MADDENNVGSSLEYLKNLGGTDLQKKIIEILYTYGNTDEALDMVIKYVESDRP